MRQIKSADVVGIGGVDKRGNVDSTKLIENEGVAVSDSNSQLLVKILKELKKIEFHLSIGSDISLENSDMEI